jgi:biotin carboxyl carrier protein
MKKFLISVNGNQYEVDVEEITSTSGVNISSVVSQPAPALSQSTLSPAAANTPAPAAPAAPVAPKAAPVAPAPSKGHTGSEIVPSPMPGTILKVNVSVGQTVKTGEVICVLEAMKMETDIVSPRDGTIASVNTTKGSSVNAGDTLVSLD